jgi:hypothetical protein
MSCVLCLGNYEDTKGVTGSRKSKDMLKEGKEKQTNNGRSKHYIDNKD